MTSFKKYAIVACRQPKEVIMKLKVIFSLLFCAAAFCVFVMIMGIIFMDLILFPAIHTDKKVGNITLKSGKAELDAVYNKVPNARGVVLYSHGNHEILSQIMPWINEFKENNYSILAYDYAGYGGSSGRAGTAQAKSDIEAAYKFLTETEKIPARNIIVAGYSVGSGPSTYLACKYPVRKLVMIAPFASASEALLPFDVPFNRFRNAELLSGKKVNLLLFHGTSDTIVPYRNSLKIYEKSAGLKTLKTYKGADHKNIFTRFKKDFWQELPL